MANVTADQFNQLGETIKVIGTNVDHMFLIFMGCLIFCKYGTMLSFYFDYFESPSFVSSPKNFHKKVVDSLRNFGVNSVLVLLFNSQNR